ncbi:ENGULFMENT AND CELL MOTILITY 2, putative [Babesia bigemina]|uniref:ENGULFMENT AND CELL MOTILITY 2, putative n=1 Tax=Babesia bigemina TaxID=5866 RepID=A0A061DDE3_BABBI|nr:ENGULFMENT AND CELL MOTILITY 2, putative [Babesia bigemina]CDR96210.1 ENGULFMENT AND CELL MOTILITY 2, putative [Babesia bigemina]|eukprot:XP_012768396.1 ENGULFMENT AND CELL MOTILITY 2, putative [Babesia bigemina]
MDVQRHLRSIFQRLLSCLIKTSCAERILLNYGFLDHLWALISAPSGLECSICNPEAIIAFEGQYGELLASLSIDSLVDTLAVQLEIGVKYRKYLEDALLQIFKKNRDVRRLDFLAGIKVDQSNAEHCLLLHESWAALDDRPMPESFGVTKSIGKEDDNLSSWGDLGFQAPLTDFRMTGVLGLQSLHFVATRHKKRAREILHLSRSLQAWFPFALTSINVTAWVLEDFRHNKLGPFSYHNDLQAVELFYMLHTYYFFSFVNYWRKHATSIFDFKSISVEFRKEIGEETFAIIRRIISDKSLGETRYYGSTLLNAIGETFLAGV